MRMMPQRQEFLDRFLRQHPIFAFSRARRFVADELSESGTTELICGSAGADAVSVTNGS
jgi:hypothetical protein